MTGESKLSSKNQIVIPKELRKYAQLKAGDKILIDGKMGKLILWKTPKNHTNYMAGLHSDIWQGVDIDKYIIDERNSWGKKKK